MVMVFSQRQMISAQLKYYSYLDSFVEPAIASVEPTTSTSQHLVEHSLHAPADWLVEVYEQ